MSRQDASIDAVARALVRTMTHNPPIPEGQPLPRWAIDRAKVILGELRGRGWAMTPCDPEPEAWKSPTYSITSPT